MISYLRLPAFVLGFHGCDRAVALRVVEGPTHLLASNNSYDWLGHGVYFWENSPVRARQWAQEKAERAKAKGAAFDPVVIGAVIDLGNCLDLLNAGAIELIDGAYEYLKKVSEKDGVALPKNEKQRRGTEYLFRKLDCTVINALHESISEQGGTAFDSVRAAFLEGEAIYPNAGFRRKSHIQICIRTTANIRGYFYPFE